MTKYYLPDPTYTRQSGLIVLDHLITHTHTNSEPIDPLNHDEGRLLTKYCLPDPTYLISQDY